MVSTELQSAGLGLQPTDGGLRGRGVESGRSRLHATAARRLTRFVGRDPEMELVLGKSSKGWLRIVEGWCLKLSKGHR